MKLYRHTKNSIVCNTCCSIPMSAIKSGVAPGIKIFCQKD